MRGERLPRALSGIAAVIVLGACSGEPVPALVVTELEVTAPIPGMKMSAGYLTLTNNTAAAIDISAITSPQFESVEMHESVIEDGVARMRQISVLTVPASTTVTLERGGKHLMLMRARTTVGSVSLSLYDGTTLLLNVTTTITQRDD